MTQALPSDLGNRIKACTVCDGLPLGPRPILQFSPSSKLLIVGQAPGRITHRKGVPFDDPSGDRLRDWLGVSRDTFYDASNIAIVPMGFCFPGTGKNGDLPPRTECAATWRDEVMQTLVSVDFTIVIGRFAIDWHLPRYAKYSVTQAVKSWQDVWPKQIVLPHPSPRNNRWLKSNPWFSKDLIPRLQERVGHLI
jgi:uracil-DNA glycosylase